MEAKIDGFARNTIYKNATLLFFYCLFLSIIYLCIYCKTYASNITEIAFLLNSGPINIFFQDNKKISQWSNIHI